MAKEPKCCYCGSKNLHWFNNDGRWTLTEEFGLPHACDARKEHFKKQFEAEKQRKKDIYDAEKKKWEAIPNDGPCPICHHGVVLGVSYGNSACPVYCRQCDGKGKVTAKVKSVHLYKLRKSLWPQMFNKKK
jgi:hypothetical protein